MPAVAVYTRVSTEMQTEAGTSLATQEAKLRAWVAYKGYELRGVFTDKACSGKSMSREDRPELNRALDSLQAGDIIAVYDLSRLARNTMDALAILALLREKKAEFYCLSMELDTKTAAGEMMYTFISSFNQFERQNTVQKVKQTMEYLKANGLLGKRPPFGYAHTGKKQPYRLVEAQQSVIAHVRGLWATTPNITVSDVVNALNDDPVARAALPEGVKYHFKTVSQWMVENDILPPRGQYQKRTGLDRRPKLPTLPPAEGAAAGAKGAA